MTDTPARTTRLRSRTPQAPPMPALPTAQSNTYGAQGRAVLHGQIADGATSFTDAFTGSRGAAASAATPRASRARRNRPTARQTIVEEVEEVEEPPPAPTSATDDRSATFIPGAAPYTARPRPAAQRQRPHDIENNDPWAVRIFLHTLPRWLRAVYGWYHRKAVKLLTWLLAAFLLLFMASQIGKYYRPPVMVEMALPEWIQIHVLHIIPARYMAEVLYLRDVSTEHMMTKDLPEYNMPGLQWGINKWFKERLEAIEADVQMLKGGMGLLNETMDALNNMLPQHLALREVDGKYEIPPAFWDALADRLASGENAEIWQGFLRTNAFQLRAAIKDESQSSIENVSREVFMQLIQQNNDWLAQQQDVSLQKMQAELAEQMRTISASTAKEIVRQSPADQMARSQLDVLVKANHIHNTHEAMRSVNFFSRGLGAVVDPYLTSPTMRRPQDSKLAKIHSMISWMAQPKAPIVALERWDEAGDCWCAAPSRSKPGKAQITVIMPYEIYPDTLTVEHVPSRGTLDISSAPRMLEVWLEAHSSERADDMRQRIAAEYGDGSAYNCETAPPGHNYVCVGKAQYDIHSSNWVQSFPIFVDTASANFGTRKMTVRAVNNWGADWTCIYRLRMTGTKVPWSG